MSFYICDDLSSQLFFAFQVFAQNTWAKHPEIHHLLWDVGIFLLIEDKS